MICITKKYIFKNKSDFNVIKIKTIYQKKKTTNAHIKKNTIVK